MSDSESNVSKLNGSSGFISYEESKSEGWSSENSVDYSMQNKRNKRKLQKRRNLLADNRIFENVLREENFVMLPRGVGDGVENSSENQGPTQNTSSPPTFVASTPQNDTLAASRVFSEHAIRVNSYYKQFGDFWNVFPKTDYVYSRHSKWYGSEVAPGIPRIPNMCRPTYRGRYEKPLSSRLLQNPSFSEYEETLYVRIKRIVLTSTTTTVTTFYKIAKTAASPAVTAASSVASAATSIVMGASSAASSVVMGASSAASSVVMGASSVAASVVTGASSAAATVSSAATTVSSWVPRVLSSSTVRTSEDEHSTWNCWPIFLLLLILFVPASYIIFSGIDPPPPYVSPFEDLSLDSVYSTAKRFFSPLVSLWGGTIWLGSLLVNSMQMIPTFFMETTSVLYGFFQYYSTSDTYRQSSEPVYAPPTTITPGPSIIYEEMNNLKHWVSESIAAALKEEELAADRRSTYSKKEILDSLMVLQNRIEKMEESVEGNRLKIEHLGTFSTANQLEIKHLESITAENQLKIKHIETLSVEDRDKLQALLKKSEDARSAEIEMPGTAVISPSIRDDVTSIVRSLLEEYHADRTGKPDYALGSNGAAIASIRCTRPFNKRSAEYVLWGILHWEHINTPDIIIKPGFMPGECWAFEGANGYVAIQLSMPIYVSGFSLEHTPKELTPFGHIESAPRKFSVWGLSSLEDKDEEFLGRFEFEDNGHSLQTFDAIVLDKPFQLIELRIESNHGHLEYTCLYRFRVHGRPAI